MLIVCLSIFLFTVGLDQLTKALCFELSADFIKGFIRIEYSSNYGMVWGLLGDKAWASAVLAVIAALFSAFVIYALIKWRKAFTRFITIALSLIVAGAVGNLIDRVLLGYVRDFIATEFMRFPTFNIADSAVTVGGIMLAIGIIFTKGGDRLIDGIFPEKEKEVETVADNEPKGETNEPSLSEIASDDSGYTVKKAEHNDQDE